MTLPTPQQLKWLLNLDLHKIAMQQMRDQSFRYKMNKNMSKSSDTDNLYVEETLHVVTLKFF